MRKKPPPPQFSANYRCVCPIPLGLYLSSLFSIRQVTTLQRNTTRICTYEGVPPLVAGSGYAVLPLVGKPQQGLRQHSFMHHASRRVPTIPHAG
jgi:hypothetical protein